MDSRQGCDAPACGIQAVHNSRSSMTIKKKTWIEARVEGSGEPLEAVSNFAFEIGASGLEETASGLRIFFPSGTSDPEIRQPLTDFIRSLRSMGQPVGDPVFKPVPEEDWGRAWRENFKPIRIGSRIVVKPPWEAWPAVSGDLVIDISPKMAFGTGSHETTRLCLEMLERFMKPGLSVLDVGTGSGILAIAAAKLGASRADGVDIEEESAENAAENFRANGVEDRAAVRLGSLDEAAAEPYGLIVANIDRKTLAPMLPRFASHAGPGTILVLSGILAEEKQAISGLIAQTPFRLIESRELGEWVGFAAVFEKE
jgi:ribosomal protein L11 methyltransferase